MSNCLLAIPLALHLIAASDSHIPTSDVRPRCRGVANHEHGHDASLCGGRTGRLDRLVETWTKFNIADRSSCLRTMMDFEPTYTELLTCLEMASDVRKLPEEPY